jgi:hypothetical protein
MLFLRRQLLRTLPFAFGSSFILGRNQLAIAARTAVQPKTSPPLRGPLFAMGSLKERKWKKSDNLAAATGRCARPKTSARCARHLLKRRPTADSWTESMN